MDGAGDAAGEAEQEAEGPQAGGEQAQDERHSAVIGRACVDQREIRYGGAGAVESGDIVGCFVDGFATHVAQALRQLFAAGFDAVHQENAGVFNHQRWLEGVLR